MGLMPVYVRDDVLKDSRVRVVPRGVERGAFHHADAVHMGLVRVYMYDVYDGVSRVPYKDLQQRFGHELNISESEPFLEDLIGVCIAELEAKEVSFWESCIKSKGFTVQNVRRRCGGFSCELRPSRSGVREYKMILVPFKKNCYLER